MSEKKSLVSFVLAIVLVVVATAGTVASLTSVYLNAPGPLATSKAVIIPKGYSSKNIAYELSKEGVIDFPIVFWLITKAIGKSNQFKSGEYQFNTSVTPAQIIDTVLKGTVVIHRMTIPEGLTSKEIINTIKLNKILLGEVVNHYPEGTLLPDTYFYIYGDRKQALLDQMFKRNNELLESLWHRRNKSIPIKTKQEALILASIVEKETSMEEERPRVAAVFLNRIKKKMRLQADPTVAYGITRGKEKMTRKLTRADLKAKSPYNTYMNYGLPPTPIANPGKASIAAVLNPLKTNELYFVVNGRGGHNFSATLRQHINNINGYKKMLKSFKNRSRK
jgi:peptidoglycan lytic transglycosylase G